MIMTLMLTRTALADMRKNTNRRGTSLRPRLHAVLYTIPNLRQCFGSTYAKGIQSTDPESA
jgi:hypothetical protein